MKLRKDLIQPLRMQGESDEEERHSNWQELLFDLIFVAAISQLALNLNANYSFITFLEFIPLFFVIWWGWLGHTIYLSRFGTDDVLHRFYTMAQMLVVASLAINIKNALTTTGTWFSLSYALLRFMLVAEYINAGKNIDAYPLTKHYSIGFGLAAALWLISAFIPPPWRFLLWGCAIFVDILTPLTAGKLNLEFPLHPTHLPERFGLLTIILIGEAIISVVYVLSGLDLNPSTIFIGVMGLIIAFSIWWGYFEEVRGAEARVQAEGKEIGRYQLWLYSHFPLLLGIVGTAAGVRHVLSHEYWSLLAPYEAWLLCVSLTIALISLSAIFLSSFSWEECISKPLLVFRSPYYLIIVLVFCTGFLGTILSGTGILAILTLLCIFKVLLSLREPPEEICVL